MENTEKKEIKYVQARSRKTFDSAELKIMKYTRENRS